VQRVTVRLDLATGWREAQRFPPIGSVCAVDAGVVGKNVIRVSVSTIALVATYPFLTRTNDKVADKVLCVPQEVLDATPY
jgi:hypothetical protein